MKYKSIVLFIFFTHLYAVNTEELFLQANKAYHQNNYQKALKLYELIEHKGCSTWYNMGNCYYQLSDYFTALVCWAKAKKGASCKIMNAITYNTSKVYQKLGYKENSGRSSWYAIVEKNLQYTSLFMWQVFFLCLLYVLFLSAYSLFLAQRFIILGIIFCIITTFGGILGIKYKMLNTKKALVKKESLLFVGMNEHFSTNGSMIIGNEVIVQKEQNGWCKVCKDNSVGWIQTDNLEFVS